MTEKGSTEVCWLTTLVKWANNSGFDLVRSNSAGPRYFWNLDCVMKRSLDGEPGDRSPCLSTTIWVALDKSHYLSWLVISVVSGKAGAKCSLPLALSSMLGLSRRSDLYQSGIWRCSTDPGESINFCVSFVTWYNMIPRDSISWGFFLSHPVYSSTHAGGY